MHYIPRSKMPQVDEKDLPTLVADMVKDGLNPSFTVLNPHSLHRHQRSDHLKAAIMAEKIRRKPILVSADAFVVDGNHRSLACLLRGELVTAIRTSKSFDETIEYLFTRPYVYEIDKSTPIRN
jgi:hypothetical protein